LVTGSVLAKLDTLVAGDNGMSTPGLWDSDGNGKIDTVYAGDLKGNVWRFNLSGATSSAWQSHFVSGTTPQPLFTALDSAATPQPQPITAQISVAKNTRTSDANYGKTFVYFGTGRYVYSSDPADMQVQTWYGLIDEGSRILSRSELKQRTFASQGTVGGYAVRVFSAATAGDMTGKKGWYVDLNYPSAQGERIVTRSAVYQLLEPVLLASSIVPDPDPCRAGGSGFVNAIDPFTGGRLTYSPFDLTDDAKFDDSDKLNNEVAGSFDPSIGMPGEPTLVGDRLVVGGSSGEIADIRVNTGNKRLGRLSWREILGD
jgi:type IV pilus assembly protein PilY1